MNITPPLKQSEFEQLSEELDIPLDFLTDSLDIDEKSRFELEDNVKLIVIKTPTENNSINESDAYYITIPIVIILTHNQIVTVNSFDNAAIKKFLNTFHNRHPEKRNMMVLKIFEKVVMNFWITSRKSISAATSWNKNSTIPTVTRNCCTSCGSRSRSYTSSPPCAATSCCS